MSSGQFQTTRWTLIRSADKGTNSTASQNALAELCEIYWYPLYAFARRRGSQVADAQEQVQEFFSELLTGSLFAKANAESGRFRSFLLKSFQHFLSNQLRKSHAQKRGAGQQPVSFDIASGEARYKLEPVEQTTPEKLFERQWALTVLDAAIECLKREYLESGRQELCTRLLPHLTQQDDARPYAEIAESLLMNETAIKVAAFRMRKRYREILRRGDRGDNSRRGRRFGRRGTPLVRFNSQ